MLSKAFCFKWLCVQPVIWWWQSWLLWYTTEFSAYPPPFYRCPFKTKSPFTSHLTLCIFYIFLSFSFVPPPEKKNCKSFYPLIPSEYLWFRVQGCLKTRKEINTTLVVWVQVQLHFFLIAQWPSRICRWKNHKGI